MAKNTEQGIGGVHKVKRTGSHLDPKGGTGINPNKGKSTPAKGGKIKADVPSNKGREGSHLVPTIAGVSKTSVRGGGGVKGHDRLSSPGPAAGSKSDQHPNIKETNLNKKHNYLTKA